MAIVSEEFYQKMAILQVLLENTRHSKRNGSVIVIERRALIIDKNPTESAFQVYWKCSEKQAQFIVSNKVRN